MHETNMGMKLPTPELLSAQDTAAIFQDRRHLFLALTVPQTVWLEAQARKTQRETLRILEVAGLLRHVGVEQTGGSMAEHPEGKPAPETCAACVLLEET